jgi:hypothetical protein
MTQDCSPQNIQAEMEPRVVPDPVPLPNFNVGSRQVGTVVADAQTLTGKELAQVTRLSKTDRDFLQYEFDQTQTLLQTEFDQTQTAIAGTTAAVNTVNNTVETSTMMMSVPYDLAGGTWDSCAISYTTNPSTGAVTQALAFSNAGTAVATITRVFDSSGRLTSITRN